MTQVDERAGFGSEEFRLFTPDEVCALLQVKKSWLYDSVEAGAIEVVKLGRQLRFRRAGLERYLAAQARGGNDG
jgi:excisionase family DNA binding protein